jgi:hypothetical protein
MSDESKDLVLRNMEMALNEQLIELIKVDPMSAPIAYLRQQTALLMLKWLMKFTEEL